VSSFLIKGLSRKKCLKGILPVRGAKNAVLKALASSILFKRELLIENIPLIEDLNKTSLLLERLGVKAERVAERKICLRPQKHLGAVLDKTISQSFRASIVLVGPLLAREGRAVFPHPGGCVIGQRPIDIFLTSFRKLGAVVKRDKDFYFLKAKRLKPAQIFLNLPSVTATETLMMTAVLVRGVTTIYNCAREPEIESLADFLNSSGAEIKGAGTHTIIVKGRGSLLKSGVFKTPPDRIEAGSFAIIASLLGEDLRITNCIPSQIRAVLEKLRFAGVEPRESQNSIRIKAPPSLKSVDIKTLEYPGFPTDLQAPMTVLLTQAIGRSLVFETIFEGRLNYLADLVRMGADITLCDPHRAVVYGPSPLRGRRMESPDIRAGLAFLTAALVGRGKSVLDNVSNIDRGYEEIEKRLNAVGAEIRRVE
jgi:UDP-N-acetylglucosamine 1-carboxyvinyltransferase